jgi:hypothetical protein
MLFRSSLNRSCLRIAMSLRMSIVHFLPRIPRLVAMGQFVKGAAGIIGVPFSQ